MALKPIYSSPAPLGAKYVVIAATAGLPNEWVLTAGDNVTFDTGTAGVVKISAASGGGGGGDVATDTIWAAKGDIVQGTGNDTAAVLSIGTNGQLLRVNAGATALEYFTPSYGTSNFDGAYSSLSGIPSTFTPASHAHGNITNAGAIGSTADLPLITTTGGAVTVGAFGTGKTDFCVGNDSRLSDARTPTTHATSHQSGGSDAIKLDDLAAPEDNTDLNASASAHGLLPKLSNSASDFLNGKGAWAVPSGGSASNSFETISVSGQDDVVADSSTDTLTFVGAGGITITTNKTTDTVTFTGSVPTTVTVADEATDTTCFPLFVTAATGDLGPKTNTSFTFDSQNKTLSVTNIAAASAGISDTIGDPTALLWQVTSSDGSVLFASGNFSVDASGNATAVSFSGPLTGNVTGNASGSSGSCTGNAATATALATIRTIGGSNFDGTGNVTSFPSPGAIGGTTPAAATFTTVAITDATSLLLGQAGKSVGDIGFRNATSGTITLSPAVGALGTVTQYLQASNGTIYCSGGADVAVADGGTGLSSGTSGGVLAFTASGTIASSGALAANALVIGGGAGVAPSTTTTGTGVLTALGIAVNTAGGPVTGGAITSSALTMATARLLGRTTASTGAVEELTLGTNVATLISLPADGTDVDAIGYRGLPQVSFSAATDIIASHNGKTLLHPSSDANARTLTIQANGTLALEVGFAFEVINDSANDVTLAITTDTLVQAGSGTTGSITIPQYGTCFVRKISSTRWYATLVDA